MAKEKKVESEKSKKEEVTRKAKKVSKKISSTKKEKKTNSKPNKEKEEKVEETEEEVISVSLKTILFLMAILIVIILAFLVMYHNEIEKGEKSVADSVALNTEGQTTTTAGKTSFSTDEGIALLKEYLNIKSIANANPQSLLEKYGFATNEQFGKYEKNADSTFIKTDIIYEDIRTQMQNYITKQLFLTEFKNIYKNSNGVTYVANINVSQETYSVSRYELVENKTKPVVQVWYTTTKDDVTSAEKTMKVEFTFTNGKWIISNIS